MTRASTWLATAAFTALAAAAAELPAGPRFKNSLGMEFVRLEPGAFLMGHDGSPLPESVRNDRTADRRVEVWYPRGGDYDERPAHQVTITKPFYLGVHEVTNRQYEEFDPVHAHQRGINGFSIDDGEAVVFVNWHEAKAFARWLSEKEGLPYRLPTEAEWEFAARAGTRTLFSTGDLLPSVFLKNPDTSWYPIPGRGRGREEVVTLYVGKTPPSPWGLYDMHGNVEEWCEDWYGPYPAEDQVDPVGRAAGHFKVTRGGSHATFAYHLRSANRMGTLPENKHWLIGLRLAIGEMPAGRPLPPVPPERYQQNVRQSKPPARRIDMKEPHFSGPVPYVKIPEGSEGPLFSRHNHDAGFAECPNGDLLAIWYTTVTERGRELAVAASRLRAGESEWEPASPFWDAPDRNDHCPMLWYDGKQTLYHFNSLSNAATWGPLAVLMRSSTDNGVTWSPARLILPEHRARQQVITGMFETKEGYWVMACDAGPGTTRGSALQISRDRGRTWQDPGGTIAGIHAGVAQRRDGSLIAFGRGSDIGGRMPQSISTDMGKTWRYRASRFPPIGGAQRLNLLRLKEGPLLFISFANQPMPVLDASGAERPVRGLFAALSYDDGETWPKIRLVSDDGPGREVPTLDARERFTLSHSIAEPKGYMAMVQSRDGLIHLISSINYYRFNLKWLETPPPAVTPR